MSARIRRIDCAQADAALELTRLRDLLGAQSQVVSARSEELTRKVFGEPLTPQQVVERVLHRVKTEGMPALLEFTRLFDRAELTPQTVRVSAAELAEAHAACLQQNPEFLESTRRIRQNLLTFQTSILHRDAMLTHPGRMEVGIRYRPVRRVAMMVPAGAASYPSTLLMTACPAQAAGVAERVGEIRDFVVQAVAETGGHLGSNLGAVELTMALHRVFDSPRDAILWDTGHQAYVHKIVTGRQAGFERLRQAEGLSGYPSREESRHDYIENSHASTVLSYAYGLAVARAQVVDEAPLLDPDLRGGQPDAGRCVHGFKHVVDQLLQLGSEIRGQHLTGASAQARIGEFENRERGHGRYLGANAPEIKSPKPVTIAAAS